MDGMNIYLYHLDAELQKLYIKNNYFGVSQIKAIQRHFADVVRLAFLLCRKEIFIPLSNYLESPLAYDVLNDIFLKMNASDNPLVLLSTAPNLKEALQKKKFEHQENYYNNPLFRYKAFEDAGCILPGKYRTRSKSASVDIERELLLSISDEGLWLPFKKFIIPSLTFEQIQYQLEAIPQLLSGQAYISDYVLPHLSIEEQMAAYADRQMNLNITRWYLKSFLAELDAICLKDIDYINDNELLPEISGKQHLSYRYYARQLQMSIMRERRLLRKQFTAFDYVSSCNTEQLIEFKLSSQWEDICFPQTKQIGKIILLGGPEMPHTDVKIGIVTALPKEFTAIKVLLEKPEEVSFLTDDAAAGNRYTVGDIKSNDGGVHRVAICMLPKYGNNFASIISSKMMAHFKGIHSLIICGIAGGIPSEVQLGDLVVSTNGIIQYDLGSDKIDSFIPKNNPKDCSDFLLEAVQFLRAKEDELGSTWLKHIDTINQRTDADYSRPSIIINKYEKKDDDGYIVFEQDVAMKTTAHFGKIGSGNAVQKNAEKRDLLHLQHGILAVEMEASGVSDATHIANHGYIAIRGICDYCDSQKNDEWQYYAAAVAASYCNELIKSIPTK